MTRPAPIVALEGPSAAGKSTTAARLAARRGWAVIAEAVDRLDPPPSLRLGSESELLALETKLLKEEERRFAAAARLAAQGTTVVCDTGFLGPLSYTAGLRATGRCEARTFRRLLAVVRRQARAERLGLADLSVYLAAPPPVRSARARADPVRHPPEFRARHEEVGRFEWEVYRPWLAARQPGRVVVVRSTGDAEAVARAVERRACRVAPLRGRSRALARLLSVAGIAELGPDAPGVALTLKKGAPSARLPSP